MLRRLALTTMAACGILAVAGALPAAPLPSHRPPARDTVDLAVLLEQNAHPLRLAEDGLRGDGARLLARAGREARFFALGEAPHLRAALPPFVGALFRLLREEAGYRYLALEEGPLIARMVSEAGRAGGGDSVMSLARRVPTAFHMYTMEELRMMAGVAASADGPAGAPGAVWGLNRVYGAWHVLERLAALAPDDRARRLARTLADSARAYEAERFARDVRWHVDVLSDDELDRLEEAFGVADSAGGEAGETVPDPLAERDESARLLEQLRVSRRTFMPYHREDPAPASFYRSARERETNMKRLFARRYREAKRTDGRAAGASAREGFRAPRVLVKSGLYHLSRGRKLVGEVPTLGNFLSELAVYEGGESFHLAVIAAAPEVRDIPLAAPFLAAAREDGPVVFDLRPLHPRAGSGGLEGVPPSLRRLVLDYDAVAVLPDTGPATVEPLQTPSFHLSPGG